MVEGILKKITRHNKLFEYIGLSIAVIMGLLIGTMMGLLRLKLF